MSQSLSETAKSALVLAKKHGATDAAAEIERSRDVETTWRDGKIEKVSDATSRSLSLTLYVDGRYGAMTTSDLRPEALGAFVESSVQMVRALAKDPHRKLPDPSLYGGRSAADLETFDPAVVEVSPDARIQRAKAAEEGARTAKGADRIVSVTTTFYTSDWETARVTSNGFEGGYRGTNASISANASMKDDDGRRPEDWADATTRRLADLPDGVAVGREATERAHARLGSKKMGSGTMSVLVEARAAQGLLRYLFGPMSGAALQQRKSFFEGKLGAVFASPKLTLTDEPLLPRGLGSRPFDGEGISSKTRTLVEKGTLRTYLLDVYYAGKLGMAPTTGRTSNVVVAPGAKSLDALTREMKSGILVTSFLGGNSNGTTGAFSLGVAGFRIAGGERKEAVGEMNLSGEHLLFWKKLAAVGNDPYLYSSTRSPSLLFDGVSIAGK